MYFVDANGKDTGIIYLCAVFYCFVKQEHAIVEKKKERNPLADF